VSHIFVMITPVRISGSENGTENLRAVAVIFASEIYFSAQIARVTRERISKDRKTVPMHVSRQTVCPD
jgi:hypothetical protein